MARPRSVRPAPIAAPPSALASHTEPPTTVQRLLGAVPALHSRLAKRLFAIFLTCALLPILALAAITYRLMGAELESHASSLRQEAKARAMGMVERLLSLQADLDWLAAQLSEPAATTAAASLCSESRRRFTSITWLDDDGTATLLAGALSRPVELPLNGWQASEGALVVPAADDGMPLIVVSGSRDGQRGALIGRPAASYLWLGVSHRTLSEPGALPIPELGASEYLPPGTDLVVLAADGNGLFRSFPVAARDEAALAMLLEGQAGKPAEWSPSTGRRIVGSWVLPLAWGRDSMSHWTIAVAVERQLLVRTLGRFRTTFGLVLVVAVLVTLLLSIRQIRHTLVPLEQLRDGTRRAMSGNFSTAVVVDSGDELEDLARSFNDMAQEIDRQFRMLGTTHELAQAVLSSLDEGHIAEVVLAAVPNACGATRAALLLERPEPGAEATLYSRASPAGGTRRQTLRLKVNELAALLTGSPAESIAERARLDDDTVELLSSSTVIPLLGHGRLMGALLLDRSADGEAPDESAARAIADQTAVALGNAHLVADLDRQLAGSLAALARAIDARSRWTAGHSERVSEMSVRLGRSLGLASDELLVLQRGSLLHDIGKIGVTSQVLDKPGPLTEDERRLIQQHVVIGAAIVEPIPGLEALRPIILQHHEQWNGSGYPNRLRRDEIHFLARIVAVADCFDAMTSPRPYRPSIAVEPTLRFIQDGAGDQFDPLIVETFLAVVRDPEEGAALSGSRERTAR